jgi:hypothetical protein
MLFGLLFEFSNFRCEILKFALEARVCLLCLYAVYKQMGSGLQSSRNAPCSDNWGAVGVFDFLEDDMFTLAND